MIRGSRRCPEEDGRLVWNALHPSPRVVGNENLPATGPYIIAANHLNGPGIWVGLAAALIASVVGNRTPNTRILGVGVAAYRDFKLFGRIPVPDQLTERLFARFYRIYGIIRMPRTSEGAAVTARAVRQMLAALRAGSVIILFPEGQNVVNFRMRTLQPGVGDFLRLASRMTIPVVPIAIAPSGATFSLSIGQPLSITRNDGGADVERMTGRAIARMLPKELRGSHES